MPAPWLSQVLARLSSRTARRPARLCPWPDVSRLLAARLSLERLEDRTAPAVFTVTGTADTGAGSLRQAILDANAAPGADTIQFAIPGSGVQTIRPATLFPVITDAVTIDGYTQPGASPNTLTVGTNA